MKQKIISTIILFAILMLSVRAHSIEITKELQLKIADTFFDDGEFYRAITEYRKFGIIFSKTENGDYAAFKVGLSYFLGEEYTTAAKAFVKFRARHSKSKYELESHYLEGISYWKTDDVENASIKFDTIIDFYAKSEFAPRALSAKALIAIDQDKPENARENLEKITSTYPKYARAGKVNDSITLVKRYEATPRKSRVLAGTMSAILPGSGYFYANHYGDGISAFIINALFIGAAVESYNEGHDTAAVIIATFGLPFYIGNIHGASNAAKKWNIEVKKRTRDEIFLNLNYVF